MGKKEVTRKNPSLCRSKERGKRDAILISYALVRYSFGLLGYCLFSYGLLS